MTERELLEQRRKLREQQQAKLAEMQAQGKHFYQRTWTAKPLVLAKGKR